MTIWLLFLSFVTVDGHLIPLNDGKPVAVYTTEAECEANLMPAMRTLSQVMGDGTSLAACVGRRQQGEEL